MRLHNSLLNLSFETNDRFNMGQESKRSQNGRKTGVVKAKSLKIACEKKHLSLTVFLGGGDGFYKHTSNNATLLQKAFGSLLANCIGANKHFNPIFSFTALFKGNMKFIDKIRFTCSIVRFVNIRADRGCTPYNLIDKYTSALTSIYLIADSDYM